MHDIRKPRFPTPLSRIRVLQIAVGFLAYCLADLPSFAGPETPGEPQGRPIAIVGATLHPVAAPKITSGTILFEEGKIVALGTQVQLPSDVQVVEASGKHLYPGLFNTDGSLGLLEINSVRATDDTREIGPFNPNVRAEVAVNPDSELIPVTRSGGVLLTLTVPKGAGLAGTSAILQLDGWTWEDMTLQGNVGMHLIWPSLHEARRKDDNHSEHHAAQNLALQEIEDTFTRASSYHAAKLANPQLPIDLRWEALRPVIAKEIPLIVDAEHISQIQSAVAFAQKHQLRLIVYGGYDAAECADLLRTANVPVIIAGTYRLPIRRGDPYDHPYTLPQRLKQSGVQFCIAGSSRFDASNIRNLPHHAAVAVGFGLSPEDALRAITLSPAEILGVAERVGSLAVGKEATIIVSDGDILDGATHVERAWIQGREVDLGDRQKRLWKKYETRIKRTSADR